MNAERIAKLRESVLDADVVLFDNEVADLLAILGDYELARPLIDAVIETDIAQYHGMDTDCPIIRQALAYREKQDKKEAKNG